MRVSLALITMTGLAAAGPAPDRHGVKTPGIQIPFEKLKPEAEFPGAPDWIAFADQIWVPNPAHNGLTPVDAKSGKLGEPVAGLDKACDALVSAFGSLWVPDCGAQKVVRLDAKTHKVTAQIASGVASGRPGIVATGDSIWVLTDAKTTLSRIDPEQNQIVSELRLPAGCGALAFGEGALWVACAAESRVLRIDPRTNLVDKRIEVSAQPRALAIGEGSVWVLCQKDGKVDRIDVKTNQVAKSIDLGTPGADGAIADGSGSVWVTVAGFPVTRIDPEANRVVQQFYGEAGGAILVGQGSVWLSNPHAGNLWRLDAKRIAATLAE
jgi:virginiamycin B lyase